MDAIREMLAERVVELEAERDALLAHVERLINAGCDMQDDYQMGDDSPHHAGIDAWAEALKDTPTTSLAKLKAQWQAEALENASYRQIERYGKDHTTWAGYLKNQAAELRRQTQEPTPNGSD